MYFVYVNLSSVWSTYIYSSPALCPPIFRLALPYSTGRKETLFSTSVFEVKYSFFQPPGGLLRPWNLVSQWILQRTGGPSCTPVLMKRLRGNTHGKGAQSIQKATG